MKLISSILLLLFCILFPQQNASVDACRDVLIYPASTDIGIQYYQMDIKQRSEIQVPFDNLISAPVWSPDGSNIAVATDNNQRGFALSVVSDFGADSIPIASVHATQPKIRWSPDGKWIAFEFENNVHIITPTGERYRQITQGDSVYYLGDWSFDGRYISISAYNVESQNILVATPETGALQEITPAIQGIFDYFVGWTPDGDGVLVTTNRFSDEMALYRFDLRNETSQPYISSIVRGISWNPTRTQFAYALSNNGFIEVYIRNWQTNEDDLLTENMTLLHENFTEPTWSPSGSYIVFTAVDNGTDSNSYEIFSINIQTREITQLTSNNRIEGDPYWIPCL